MVAAEDKTFSGTLHWAFARARPAGRDEGLVAAWSDRGLVMLSFADDAEDGHAQVARRFPKASLEAGHGDAIHGLLAAPARTSGNQRRYGQGELDKLGFIRHARELGFEVDAIRELLALAAQPDRSCAEVDKIARRHMAEVERRIERLMALKAEDIQRGAARFCSPEQAIVGTLCDGPREF